MDSAVLDVVYVTRSPWEFGWDAIVAISTFAAVAVALWVGQEPRRLEKKKNLELSAYTSILLANEIEAAYVAVKGVVDFLAPRKDMELTEATSRWCQLYVLTAKFPTLSGVIDQGRVNMFTGPTAVELCTLYGDAQRTSNAFAPQGQIDAVDFAGIKAGELAGIPTGLLASIDASLTALAREVPKVDLKIEQRKERAAKAAEFITSAIGRKTMPPRIGTNQ
jgi:hypothetical protein